MTRLLRVHLSSSALVAAVTLAPVVSVAHAAEQTVTVSSDRFAPATVTVGQGDTLRWNNTGGFHNVHFDDGSFVQPSMPDNTLWSASRAFSTPGTFAYYCEAHGGPNGFGMSGTVVVNPATAPPGAPPAPPAPVLPVADRAAPSVALGVKGRQKILQRGALVITARVDEPSIVTASGAIATPGASKALRLIKARRQLAPGVGVKLKLRVPRKHVRVLRRLLRRKARMVARVAVTARDSAGNERTLKRKLRVER